MLIPLEEKKAEAVNRMQLLGLFPEVIRQFKEAGRINQSEPPAGACFWISEEIAKEVKRFEEEESALVYHVVKTPYKDISGIFIMYSFLFVSDRIEEWEPDRADIKRGISFAYVFVEDQPYNSEAGNIAFKLGPAKGLLRIG